MVLSMFPRDLFAELDRLQRQMQESFDVSSPSIRGWARGYPALNIGSAPESVEIYAFAPGIDPSKVELTYDRGVLAIAGQRTSTQPAGEGQATVHIKERFDGEFRRVVSLPDDVDPNAISADYRDGVLHVSIKRREESRPRRIEVQ
jgi:HSP20 family protein